MGGLFSKTAPPGKDSSILNQNDGSRASPTIISDTSNTTKNVPFDPSSDGYDYDSALAAGMGPTGDGTAENAGHWGSVVETSAAVRKQYGLPEESYMVLKGRKHQTFDKAQKGEEDRGFKIITRGGRYFSVPQSFSDN